MKRFLTLLAMDFRFQFRQGIHPAYMGITALLALVLALMPEPVRRTALPVILFGEPSIMGMFFAGGLLFFEQDQGIIPPLFATPLRPGEYILAKSLSLGAVSVGMAALLLILFSPPSPMWLPALAGVLLTAALFTLSGIILSMSVKSVMTYLMVAGLADLPASLPILRYFGLWDSPLFRLIPVDGTLRLLTSAARPDRVSTPGETALSLLILAASVAVVWFPAAARIRKAAVTGKGGMK